MKPSATLLNRLSIMFIALSIIGVGLIIISNISVPFLPDTFDAARPQDTWSCCAAPRKTAHALRWPLFLTGGLLLFISIVWGYITSDGGYDSSWGNHLMSQRNPYGAPTGYWRLVCDYWRYLWSYRLAPRLYAYSSHPTSRYYKT